jgi:hypothetical protein
MTLSLEAAQTLALGPFNPYIILPEWLVKHAVCEDAEVEIRFIPLKQGTAFAFKEVQWQIDSQLLLVGSITENCGELVAKVIRLLPHTPVHAVGNNFHYVATDVEWDAAPLSMLGQNPPGFERFGQFEQTRWACVLRNKDLRVEVTVAKSTPGVAILFNFHRDTKGSDEAVAAAEQFPTDRQTSREILHSLTGQEVPE